MPASARWWWAVPTASAAERGHPGPTLPTLLPAMADEMTQHEAAADSMADPMCAARADAGADARADSRDVACGDAAVAGVSAADDDRSALARARGLLERGEYGQVLRLLEPIADRQVAGTVIGAEARLLLATALIGQGRPEEAAGWCRALRGSADPELRARARDLLQVLEAPALERPRDWSLTLPDLGGGAQLETLGTGLPPRRRRRQPDPPPPPPVGPTRAPLGFAALAGLLLLLVLLASLLGGCVEVRTDLRVVGPGRLQVSHELRSVSGVPGPWQQRLPDLLAPQGFRSRSAAGATRLESPVLPARQAIEALSSSFEQAARLADLTLPPPRIELQERNWILGVRQRLTMTLDLRALPSLPGLALSIDLEPFAPRSVDQSVPRSLETVGPQRLRWPLQPGQINTLTLRCWRWSPLGLGAGLIALLLPIVVALQHRRRQLGFGLPELPA